MRFTIKELKHYLMFVNNNLINFVVCLYKSCSILPSKTSCYGSRKLYSNFIEQENRKKT